MGVRVGIIGVGIMGQAHVRALSKVEHADLVGVCDVNLERAREVSRGVNAEVFEDISALIDPDRIDALFVCTPPFARGDAEEVAARNGIHVFAEKPLGLDMQDVRRKERVIEESGIINSSGYCLRYLDTVQKARAYLLDKQVDLISGYYYFGQLSDRPGWWRRLELSGGQFVDQSTHQVDLIRYLTGGIVEVEARFENRSLREIDPDATIYDVGTVALTLKSGGIGTLSCSCSFSGYSRSGLELLGRDFYVRIDGHTLRISDECTDTVENSCVDYVLEQDRAFIQAVESGLQNRILCSYSESVKTLDVTLAANRSAIQQEPVRISSC